MSLQDWVTGGAACAPDEAGPSSSSSSANPLSRFASSFLYDPRHNHMGHQQPQHIMPPPGLLQPPNDFALLHGDHLQGPPPPQTMLPPGILWPQPPPPPPLLHQQAHTQAYTDSQVSSRQDLSGLADQFMRAQISNHPVPNHSSLLTNIPRPSSPMLRQQHQYNPDPLIQQFIAAQHLREGVHHHHPQHQQSMPPLQEGPWVEQFWSMSGNNVGEAVEVPTKANEWNQQQSHVDPASSMMMMMRRMGSRAGVGVGVGPDGLTGLAAIPLVSPPQMNPIQEQTYQQQQRLQHSQEANRQQQQQQQQQQQLPSEQQQDIQANEDLQRRASTQLDPNQDLFHEHPLDPNTWGAEFAALSDSEFFQDTFDADVNAFIGRNLNHEDYTFLEDNPFQDLTNAIQIGQEALRQGEMSQAVQAFEAAARQNPTDAKAWYLLGMAHAENDDDQKAISALRKSISVGKASSDKADEASTSTYSGNEYAQEALLALGVSHTNELDESRALNYLRQWLDNHPQYRDIQAPNPEAADSSVDADLLPRFITAVRLNPSDPDLHTILGVLYNLSRDYEEAADHFRSAVQLAPDDYRMWNKLGATLANGGNAPEALRAYRRAVEINPKFVRAWVNVGTAYTNQGGYERAVRYYLRALEQNQNADHVWSYVRTCVLSLGRDDLLDAVSRNDIQLLRSELSS